MLKILAIKNPKLKNKTTAIKISNIILNNGLEVIKVLTPRASAISLLALAFLAILSNCVSFILSRYAISNTWRRCHLNTTSAFSHKSICSYDNQYNCKDIPTNTNAILVVWLWWYLAGLCGCVKY